MQDNASPIHTARWQLHWLNTVLYNTVLYSTVLYNARGLRMNFTNFKELQVGSKQ